jgi:tetratricopeptide (TPR) repeat protein
MISGGAIARVLASACVAGALGVSAAGAAEQPASASEAVHAKDPSQWRRIALARALNAATAVDDPYRRGEAFASVANAQVVIDTEAEADRTIHQAVDAAQKIAEPEFRGWVLHDIVLAQIAADDLLGARQTAERIEAERPQDKSLSVIAGLQLRSGNLDAAKATALRIRDLGSKGELLRQLVATHVGRDKLDVARQIVKDIDDDFFEALALGDIALAELRKGRVAQAYELAADARRGERSQVFGRIALTQADRKDIPGALQSVDKMTDELIRAPVQGRIAVFVHDAGDAARAKQLMSDALDMLRKVRGREYRKTVALSQMARMQAGAGDAAGARATLQQAHAEANKVKDLTQRDDALDFVGRAYARIGEPAGALAIAEQMLDRVTRALLVRDVIAMANNSDEAARELAKFDDPLILTAASFGRLGQRLLQPNRPAADEAIAAARAAVRNIEEAQLKPAALAALAAANVTIGDVEGGWSILQESLAAAESLARPDQRASAYVRIVNSLNDRLMFLGRPAKVEDREPAPTP